MRIIALFVILIPLSSFSLEFNPNTFKEDAFSPVTTVAWPILLGGSLLTATIVFDKHNLDSQSKKRTEFDPPFKRYGYIGEVLGWGYLNGLYILGHGIHAYYTKEKRSYERSEIMTSSSFFTLLTTSILKVSIDRKRPNFPEKKDSFPSGHSAMAFNFAAVVTAEHGLYWGVPAHILAGAISYSRVNDGWHWLSDIVAGATIGMSYGWGVYLNRRKKKVPFLFSIYPGKEKNSLGGRLSFNF